MLYATKLSLFEWQPEKILILVLFGQLQQKYVKYFRKTMITDTLIISIGN